MSTATAQPKNAKTNLDETSALLSVDFGLMGNTRKIRNVGDKGSGAAVETNAEKEMVSFSKKLLLSPEFEAIKQHDGETKRQLQAWSLPSMFKAGIYRIPAELITLADDYLTVRQSEREELVNGPFASTYQERVGSSVDKLEKAGCLTDYLSTENAVAEFTLQWFFVAVSVPAVLQKVNAELFRVEEQKLRTHTAQAVEAMQQLLRQEMAQLVEHMVDRLSDSEDGKRKVFKDSSIEKTREALELLEARNLTGDKDLERLAQRARDLMEGVDAEILRDDDSLRKMVATGFGEIKQAMSSMIVDQPSRRYRSED